MFAGDLHLGGFCLGHFCWEKIDDLMGGFWGFIFVWFGQSVMERTFDLFRWIFAKLTTGPSAMAAMKY